MPRALFVVLGFSRSSFLISSTWTTSVDERGLPWPGRFLKSPVSSKRVIASATVSRPTPKELFMVLKSAPAE